MPTSSVDFGYFFQPEYLRKLFYDRLLGSKFRGVDGTAAEAFELDIVNSINFISAHVLAGEYTFSRFKEKLILKGPRSFPRAVSVPTIRDALVLRALCDYIHTVFPTCITRPPHEHVAAAYRTAKNSAPQSQFIRIDVENFYPSINHRILTSKLQAVIGNGNGLTLIASAIRNTAEKDLYSFVGVPQGLSISNALANIYFLGEDSVFDGAIFWRRYVDDMLLISDINEATNLLQMVRQKLKDNLRLDSHQFTGDSGGKTTIQPVDTGVGFLGFHISRARVSIKKSSIEKLMSSLVNILTSFSHRGGEERLIWKLNLRITGCIYDGKPIGWIFFFRQMDDLSQLHRLDHFLFKELQRFNLHNITTRMKTFIKAYREVRFNQGNSSYVPDFDNFSLADMVNTISLLTNRPLDQVAQMQRSEIEREFFRLIKKEASLLERETVNFIAS